GRRALPARSRRGRVHVALEPLGCALDLRAPAGGRRPRDVVRALRRDARCGPGSLPLPGGRVGGGRDLVTAGRVFPLSAVVGQGQLLEALLINAVDPGVGGVLIRGERGTAKTTAVRGLAPLLPGQAPLVELPLGTTLDRLVGSLDLARALDGEHRFEAGLLSKADGGIL